MKSLLLLILLAIVFIYAFASIVGVIRAFFDIAKFSTRHAKYAKYNDKLDSALEKSINYEDVAPDGEGVVEDV